MSSSNGKPKKAVPVGSDISGDRRECPANAGPAMAPSESPKVSDSSPVHRGAAYSKDADRTSAGKMAPADINDGSRVRADMGPSMRCRSPDMYSRNIRSDSRRYIVEPSDSSDASLRPSS